MEPYVLPDGISLCENALFLRKSRTLVVADLQLGREQQLRALGHNVRYEDAGRMLLLLRKLVTAHGAGRLVIDGDLKHEFGRISSQERRDVLRMLRELGRRAEVVIVRGNHDTITKPLADEAGVPFVDAWERDGVLCVHGHEAVDAPRGVHTVVIGHVHPAVVLHDGVRAERAKCFLVGKHGRKRLVVLPSLSTLTYGTDVLTTRTNSPFLTERSLARADVYVLADEIRPFGTVGKLRRTLG